MSGMVEALNRAAATWWDWTVISTGQGAFLLLLAGIALFAGKSMRPDLRYGLLLLVLLKFAVPPVVGVAYGFSDLLARALANEPTPALSTHVSVAVETTATRLSAPQAAPVAPYVPQAPAPSGLAWLLLFETAGATIILALIARQWAAARRLVKRSAQGDLTLNGRFHAMARAMKLRRTPQLCLSEEASAPQSGGILRPFVLLPAWAAPMPEDELDILLAHELAHVRRMDALVNGLQAASQALLWWNPAVWWLNRRIREEREFCCDDLVLSRGIASGAAYSRTLVNVAERVSLPQSSWAMAGMADNFGAIDQRVRRALEGGHARRGWSHYGALAVLLIVAGWVLPGATDGAEKEFDAIEAAEVESAFRIHEFKSDKVGRDANGAYIRHGNVSFDVHSSDPALAKLHVTAKGEFLYPAASGEAHQCVVTGEITATYREMSFTTTRLVLDKDGVVDFGKATLDSEAIKGMTSESIVLDLRDGTFAMQDGKADTIEAVKLAERNAKPADLSLEIKAGKMTGNQATGVLTSLEDATVTLNSSAEDGDVTIQGKFLRLSDFEKGNDSGVFEGEMQATHSEFSITATRLERGETLLFSDATLETKDFGTITAEQIRVDLVARRFDILNGTVDEARLKAALGQDAKNAPKGEWLSLPFAVEPQIGVDAIIVDVDGDLDVEFPFGTVRSMAPWGAVSDVRPKYWNEFKTIIDQLVRSGDAILVGAPNIVTLDGETGGIEFENVVTLQRDGEKIEHTIGFSLEVTPTIRTHENGERFMEISTQYTRRLLAKEGEVVTPEPLAAKFAVEPVDSGSWSLQFQKRDDGRVDIVMIRFEIIAAGNVQ